LPFAAELLGEPVVVDVGELAIRQTVPTNASVEAKTSTIIK